MDTDKVAAQIKEAIKSDPEIYVSDLDVSVSEDGDNVVIVLKAMYEYVPVNLGLLSKIATILGTDKIDIGNHESWDGCDSCDYGSSYEVTLYASK